MKEQRSTAFKSRISRRITALLLAAALSVLSVIPVSTVPAQAASTTTWGVFIGQRIKPSSKRFKIQMINNMRRETLQKSKTTNRSLLTRRVTPKQRSKNSNPADARSTHI